jgi:hypothetical protein
MFVPGDGIQWPVVLGTAGVVAVGEIVIRMAEHKMSSLSNLASTDTVTPRQ